MRKGEILSLRRDDLEFNTNTIHIRHSLSYTKENGYQLLEPKTKGSKRTIVVSGVLMNKLKKHLFNKYNDRDNANELWKGGRNVFLFSADLGTPLYPGVPNRWWNRFLNRINKKRKEDEKPLIKKVRFHDFRHTFASGLIHKGGNVNKISKYLGHASISTTMDIYGHYIQEDTEIADLIDSNFN